MALSLTEVQALSDDEWLPGSKSQWGKGNIMIHKLVEKADRKGSSLYARAVLEYAKTRGGPMGVTTTFETAKKATLNAAQFPWSYFWAGATIDIDDMTQISGGDDEIDVVFKRLDNMQRSCKAYLGDSLWELRATQVTTFGTEVRPLYGIADMMNQSNTSPAFGRINLADLGTSDYGTNIWKCFQDANTYTMDFGTMQILRQGCRTGNETFQKPNMYVTTEVNKDRYEESLNAAKRHSSDQLASAGFDSVMVGLVPMVADDRCPDDYVHGFNWNNIFFHIHKDFDFGKGPVWKEPYDGASQTTQMKIVVAFLTDERRAHGRLTAVTS